MQTGFATQTRNNQFFFQKKIQQSNKKVQILKSITRCILQLKNHNNERLTRFLFYQTICKCEHFKLHKSNICLIIHIILIINLFTKMGKTEILILAIVGIAAIGLFNLGSNMQNHENLMFKIWKEKYSKSYNGQQNSYRLQVWLQNLAFAKEHNARYDAGHQTYQVQMNSFADMTSQQFGAKYLGLQKVQVTDKCNGKPAPSDNLPTEVDWTSKGKVTAVKNQGQCGSCWAFSTTGSLQGAYALTKNQQASFSQQQLVDCSRSYKNQGCNGGWMDSAFYYVKDNGITLQSKYPYKGVDGTCHYNSSTDKAWTISDCTDVEKNKQLSLRAAVAQQPVSVAIEADHMSFQLYKKGVYTGLCGTKLDHGVLAVGYGVLDGKNYWKVKNSWGSGWGSSGYILIQRTGDGKGHCGIYEAASFPIA